MNSAKGFILGLALGVGALLLIATPVSASYVVGASSRVTGLLISDRGTFYCGRGQAKIGNASDPGDGQAWVRAAMWHPTKCFGTDPLVVAPHWLTVVAQVYRNGSYCGSTAPYENATNMSLFGAGGKVCGNPSGSQTFQGRAFASAYDQSMAFHSGGWAPNSPSVSY